MLIGNGSALNRIPGQRLGGVANQIRPSWDNGGSAKGGQRTFQSSSFPVGYSPTYGYLWPLKARDISTSTRQVGGGVFQASGELGIGAAASFGAAFSFVATGSLVSSGQAQFVVTGGFSASTSAVVESPCTFVGSAAFQAIATATATLQSDFIGRASFSAQPAGDGFISADFGATQELTSGAIAASVWSYSIRTLSTAASGGLTAEQASQLEEIWRIHGLKPGQPLQVAPNVRTTGSITQAITETGSTTTVERV